MTADQILADRFLRAAPIAAVYADGAGGIDAFDVVGFETPPDGIVLCCAAGQQVAIAAAALARIATEAGLEAALAALRAAAADAGVCLTPHRAVVQRAMAAVETVNVRIAVLQRNGGLRIINAAFKAARDAGTAVRYRDFLHAKKIGMLGKRSRPKLADVNRRRGTKLAVGVAFKVSTTRMRAMQEIKPNQIWGDGLQQVRVVNAFGVRIVIQPAGGGSDEEIAEDDFRKRYNFVADA